MGTASPTTRAGAVYEQIRADIMRGRLQPGQRLRFVELTEKYSVSQSVVREALTRLAEQGLAISLPQQGFRVVTLSLMDLDELTEARRELESLVFRRAVERGDVHWESAVVAAHHLLAATPPATPDGEANPEWDDAHERFHRALLDGCGNSRLLEVALSLRESAALYRHWSGHLGDDPGRDVAAEHRGLVDAALARDADLAAERLATHIERTSAALRPVADSAQA
ncbi:GntR family transcriptional regulator [Rhodococcus sp. NPDC003348]